MNIYKNTNKFINYQYLTKLLVIMFLSVINNVLAGNLENIMENNLINHNAILVNHKNLDDLVYKTYPLSNIRKVSNQVKAKREVTLQAKITSFTYQINPNQKLIDTFNNLRNDFAGDYIPIMWCENRDCGSSALWANSVFNNSELTGIDDAQNYIFLQKSNLTDTENPDYLAIYAVTRGNQKSYIHIEQINCANQNLLPDTNTLFKILSTLNNFQLPLDFNDGYFALISQMLKQNRNLHIAINSSKIDLWRTKLNELNAPMPRIHLQLSDNKHNQIDLITGTTLLQMLRNNDNHVFDLPNNFTASTVWFEAVRQLLISNPNLKLKIVGKYENDWHIHLSNLNTRRNQVQFEFSNNHNFIQLTN